MGISDGQPVNAAVTNPAFLDANADDTALGKITLNNISDPTVSGSSIINIQRELNSLNSFLGKAINIAQDALPSWVNSQVGTTTDSVFIRADSLTQRFDGTFGHAHDGSDGEGPLLPSTSITGVPYRGFFIRGIDLSGVTGLSTDVSTELTGKVPSTGSASLGVVVTAPYNRVILRQATGVNTGDKFEDGSGNEVYGRVTESVGVWTLTYYVDIAGTETAYSFSGSNAVAWYFQELYDPMLSTPVYDTGAFQPSDNATADVLDATETQAGKVLFANLAPPAIASAGVKGSGTRTAYSNHTHEGVHSILVDGDPTIGLGDITFKAGSGITVAWNAGKVEISVTTLNTPHVEFRTVTVGEAAAKQLTLAFTPNNPNAVIVDIIGIGPQFNALDYTVSGAVLDWSGLGMDSLPIDSGDKIRIVYWS